MHNFTSQPTQCGGDREPTAAAWLPACLGQGYGQADGNRSSSSCIQAICMHCPTEPRLSTYWCLCLVSDSRSSNSSEGEGKQQKHEKQEQWQCVMLCGCCVFGLIVDFNTIKCLMACCCCCRCCCCNEVEPWLNTCTAPDMNPLILPTPQPCLSKQGTTYAHTHVSMENKMSCMLIKSPVHTDRASCSS